MCYIEDYMPPLHLQIVHNTTMVLVNTIGNDGERSYKMLLSTTILGVVLLTIPITLIYINPISLIVDYRLRLDNGTLIHDLLRTELEGPKLYMYLFNVTNAQQFRSGLDLKLKLKEIGPFVYQEYRTTKDLEINREPGLMRYTPKMRVEFIPEESYGRPEDTYLTLPNIPLLSVAAHMSKYPYIMQQIFNNIAAGINSKAFINISANDYYWGYSDPLIDLANTMLPGLFYFKSFGLLERFFEFDVDHRMELGTTTTDKFSVKSLRKIRLQEKESSSVSQKIYYFNNSYEGAVFPPGISRDMEINIFRHNMCKSMPIQHVGLRTMYYGGEAFVYKFHNKTLHDYQLCDLKGWCPGGLANLAPCYFDMPFAMSKGHFLDADPLVQDGVEGLTPDRNIHDSEIAIDPIIGVTVSGHVSLQANLFLADMGYNPETKVFKNTTVLPLSQVLVKHPRMLKEVKTALRLVYTDGPAIILAANILCTVLGLGLLLYSAWLVYANRVSRKRIQLGRNSKTETTKACIPLMLK